MSHECCGCGSVRDEEVAMLRAEVETANQRADKAEEKNAALERVVTDLMKVSSGYPGSCGHPFACVCAWDAARALIPVTAIAPEKTP